ncbi:MAG: glycosyltransferase [Lachnospiraceae bacterium]|nr:glycosyltransferase [Lachnospiraceae bacterium]
MEPFSVCIIAKNEEKHIEKCLKALHPLHAEIILVDTGSTDRTKELALKYTEHIYDFTWVQDFSAARNFSAEKASNDWILVIDCDEYVTNFDPNAIRAIQKNPSTVVGLIEQQSLLGEADDQSMYIDSPARFYNKKFYHFTGTIHEQIVPYDGNISFSYMSTGVIVSHDGYFGSPEERYEKNMRNTNMLVDALKKEPDNPYLLFQLGQSYYAMQDYKTALSYYQKALTQPINYSSESGVVLAIGTINCLNELHRSEEALVFLDHYEELSQYADFVLLMGHVYTNMGNFLKAMTEYLKATTIPKFHKAGSNSFLPFYHIGNIYRALGDVNMAKMMYTKAIEYQPAKQALDELS